jgi:hypothetical protein
MLHILNGTSVEDTMRQSSIKGELFSFRDALISGPVTSSRDKESWRTTRAKHLSETYEVEFDECERGLTEQEKALQSYSNHDEVVMWFEHDVFCQLNLLYLLDWFANVDLKNTELSLVNIGSFPGRENFRGLGELNSDELGSLFPQRQKLSDEHLDLGSRAWQAFQSADPTSIEELIKADTSELPFLSTALTSHLRRFPAVTNGLGEIERSALELVDLGNHNFEQLFPKFVRAKAVYGLGDSQLWISLVDLTHGPQPLITSEGDAEPQEISHATNFALTETGKSVLNGESDFIKINGIDKWLGGVHLHGRGEMYRWDATSEKLLYC